MSDLTDADYDDIALAPFDAAYRRKAAAEPGYEATAQARYCCECANLAADRRCLAWERLGATESWRPTDRAPRRCRGFELRRHALYWRVSITEPGGRAVEVDTPQGWTLAEWQTYAERYHGPECAVTAVLPLPQPAAATEEDLNLSGISPEFAARLSAEDLNDIAAGDIPLETVQAFEEEAIAREAEDLKVFFEERAGILEHDAGLPRPEAELEAARMTATLASNRGYLWPSLRAVLAEYPALLTVLPDTPGPVDALPRC